MTDLRAFAFFAVLVVLSLSVTAIHGDLLQIIDLLKKGHP